MKLPTYKNKDVCIEYCRFSPSIVNINAYTKFGKILSICSQDIERNKKLGNKSINSVTNLRKMTGNNPSLNLVNINAHTKYGQILSISSRYWAETKFWHQSRAITLFQMMCNNSYLDLVYINVFTKFGKILSICFVWFDFLRPINNLSVKQGRVFLGWTSTKQGKMCLAQGPKRSHVGEAWTRGPSVSSQALYHWATALPYQFVLKILTWNKILTEWQITQIQYSPTFSKQGIKMTRHLWHELLLSHGLAYRWWNNSLTVVILPQTVPLSVFFDLTCNTINAHD